MKLKSVAGETVLGRPENRPPVLLESTAFGTTDLEDTASMVYEYEYRRICGVVIGRGKPEYVVKNLPQFKW